MGKRYSRTNDDDTLHSRRDKSQHRAIRRNVKTMIGNASAHHLLDEELDDELIDDMELIDEYEYEKLNKRNRTQRFR